MKISKISVFLLLWGALLQSNNSFTQDTYSNIIGAKTAIVLAGTSFYVYHKYLSRSKRFERSLRNEYTQKFNALKKAFKFSNAEWNQTITHINQAKQFNKNYCYTSHNQKVFHDPALGKEIIDLTKKYLKKYGINPNCVNILDMKKEIRDNGTACVGRASPAKLSYKYYIENKHEKIIEYQMIEPATIYLNKDSLQTEDKLHHIISHEVTHLVEQHGTESGRIFQELNKKGYNDTVIINNQAWQNYLEVSEKCADLLPCMHDTVTAQSFFASLKNQCRNNNPHAKIKTSEHPTRWSQYQWLKNYMKIT